MNDPTGKGCVSLRLALAVLVAIPAAGLAIGCGPQTAQAPNSPNGTPISQSPQTGPAPQAQQPPQSGLTGQWRTTISTGTITITFMANGQYMQVGQPNNGDPAMGQNGPYQLVAPNTIIFTVTDYSPKTRIILVPCGIPNDPVCNVKRIQNIPKPPGSRYAYSFNGPNVMILNNEQTPETMTFTRVGQ